MLTRSRLVLLRALLLLTAIWSANALSAFPVSVRWQGLNAGSSCIPAGCGLQDDMNAVWAAQEAYINDGCPWATGAIYHNGTFPHERYRRLKMRIVGGSCVTPDPSNLNNYYYAYQHTDDRQPVQSGNRQQVSARTDL